MKIVKLTLFTLCCSLIIFSNSLAQGWRELGSEHFRVYFTDNENFAKDVLGKAENYYMNIASDLDYPRYSEFWTWERRVKIYIYPDHASYLRATGQQKWSQGMADYTNKQIKSYIWGQGFVESLLPHEIAHLVFRDFVGFKGEVPLWLDEGVAQWSEKSKRQNIKAMARQLYDNDSILSLADMMKIDIRNVTGNDRVYIRSARTKSGDSGVLFLSGDNLVNTYYLQAVSLVGFLIERYGSSDFAVFCRQLRDGKTLEEALKATYPTHIRDLAELENKWREYLANL
ncbi:MAG: hypothetical protein V2A59_02530 [Candidatus Omnitrophota bacterium]